MRKDSKLLNRSLALAIAAAMTVTSVPSSVLAADLFGDGSADVAPVAVQEMAETDVFDSGVEEAVEEAEEVFTAPAVVEEATVDTFNVPVLNPGQVVGLAVDETGVLKWDAITAADYYRVYVTDASNTPYATENNGTAETPVYVKSYGNSYDLKANLPNLYAYTKDAEGRWGRVVGADGKYIQPTAGGTYTVTVCAVNEAYNSSVDGELLETTVGAVSAAVQYTIPTVTLDKVMNLRVEDDCLYFDYNREGAGFEAEIKDPSGTEYNVGKTWVHSYDSAGNYYSGIKELGYAGVYKGMEVSGISAYAIQKNSATNYYEYKKDAANKEIMAFQTGVAYTIRVRAVSGEKTGEWSDPAVVTLTEPAVPAAPTVKVKGEFMDWTLEWSMVDGAVGYEYVVKDAANEYRQEKETDDWDSTAGQYKTIIGYADLSGNESANNPNWKYTSVDSLKYNVYVYDAANNVVKDGNGLPLQPFKEGQQYTIQVRAYNTTSKGDKQYSQFSQPVSVTFAPETKKLEKPEGLEVRGSVLSWKEVEGARSYEIRVVDNLERNYYRRAPWKDADGKDQYDYLKSGWTAISLTPDSDSLFTYQYQEPEKEWHAIKNPNDGAAIEAFRDYFIGTDAVKTAQLPVSYTLYVKAKDGDRESDWSNGIKYTVTDKAIVGIKETPAKVSGVRVKTESDRGAERLQGATLVWNYLEKVGCYEIVVKDAAGNEYSWGYDWDKGRRGELERRYVGVDRISNEPSYQLSSLADLKAYVMAPGSAITTAKGADGKDLLAMTPGQTYTIQVRAVNSYQELDTATGVYSKEQKLYGEWSDPATYTVPAAETISDLSFVKEEGGDAYFTYSAKVSANVWYQVAEDAAFTALVHDWQFKLESDDKLTVSTDGLVPGKTYYVRALCAAELPDQKELASMTIPTASFTVAPKAPKNITGLALYKVDENEIAHFRFDAVLEERIDKYEIQCSMDGTNWSLYATKGEQKEWNDEEGNLIFGYYPGDFADSFEVDLNEFDEGTLQVRVVAYTDVYNEATGKTDKLYGQVSAPVSVPVVRTATAISALKLVEKTPAGYVFSFTGDLRSSERVEVWYSTDASFTNNKKLTAVLEEVDYNKNLQFTLSYSNFEPGKSYYVKARVKNPNAKRNTEMYSAFTDAVKVSAVIPRIKVWGAAVTATSVTLNMDALNEDYYLTGYEVQKKVDRKFVALTKTTDNTFKDTKLKKDTTYQYRVRPYYYDSETKKTKNGTWVYYETTTWGGSLKATARAASKNSIKLSWKKISGAQGYEIYRLATSSYTTERADGRSNGYDKYQLIKTIKKGTTVKYTDKKLNKNLAYQYKVVAYKVADGKKYTITEYTYPVNLAFDSAFALTDTIEYANGKVKVTWSPVYGATGYLAEKYNSDTEVWSVYKKLKAKTSSITFPKNTGDKDVLYRVRAYKGTEYSNPEEVAVKPYLAAVTGVKAKANAANGSITVSWKAVAGADYYEVYRTTSSYAVYNKNAKTYGYEGGRELTRYVADASKVSGYREAKTSEKNVTSFVDAPLTYTVDGATCTVYAGPTPGVKYYYYVVAYKNTPQYGYKSNEKNGEISSGASKAASATVSAVKKPAKTKISKITAAKKKATLKWKKVSKADGYVIYRSTNKKKGYEEVGTITKGSTVKYTDKKLTSGKTYYYKVKAFTLNEAGLKVLSNFSAVKSVKAK